MTRSTVAARLPRRQAWPAGTVTSAEASLPDQMARIYGFLKGMHAAHLIDLGVVVGLFDALTDLEGAATPDQLAEAAGIHPEYAAIWCEAACALELLDRLADGAYTFAPHMAEILGRPDSNYYLGGFPAAHFQVARDYSRYPELFRSGDVFTFQAHDQAFLHSVAEGLRTLPRMFLDAVLPKLPQLEQRLEDGAHLLDVGCGGGYAVVEFATRYPNVSCVGIDLEPTSIEMAMSLIAAHGLGDRVDARVVDGSQLPHEFEGAFDLVTQFLVLHEIHPSIKARVVGQCAAALRPRGLLVLFDERYPSKPEDLRDRLQIYAVMAQWYESTWGNTINTREEIRDLISGAGLSLVNETQLSRFYIVVAEKP